MKTFKLWAYEMWYTHCDETASWGQPLRYTAQEYFAKYKWWLKREYRYQTKKDSK